MRLGSLCDLGVVFPFTKYLPYVPLSCHGWRTLQSVNYFLLAIFDKHSTAKSRLLSRINHWGLVAVVRMLQEVAQIKRWKVVQASFHGA